MFFPPSLLPVLVFALQAHSYALPNPQAVPPPLATVPPPAAVPPPATVPPPAAVPPPTAVPPPAAVAPAAAGLPQAAAPTTPPAAAIPGALPAATDFSSLPQSYYDAFTSVLGDYSVNSAELASESKAYASYTQEFYRTVHPTKLAAISSYNKAESAAYASWTSDLYGSIGPAQLASESAAYESWTQKFYATAHPTVIAAISSYNKAESSAYAAWTSDLYETIGTSEYKALTSEYAQWTKEQAVYATYTGTGIPPGITASPIRNTNSSQAGIAANAVVPANPDVAPAAVAPTVVASPAAAKETFVGLHRTQSEPAAYAVTCTDSSSSVEGDREVNYAACFTVVDDICNVLTNDNLVTEQWVWGDRGEGCAMGYWIPVLGEGKHALMPTPEECAVKIFGQMRNVCIPVNGGIELFNAATVNIVVPPSAESAGQQVDSGKTSYLLAKTPYPCGPKGCVMLPASSQVTS